MYTVLFQLSLLVTWVLSVSAELMSPMKNFNVTSPVSNGPYVAGQVLPCTYRLFSEVDSSSLRLQIALQPETTTIQGSSLGPNATIISDSADVTKTEASLKRNGNQTYYEHSINYHIPNTTLPGRYQVVFLDLSTNTQLPVPIEIRPVDTSTSATLKPSSSARGVSMFNDSPANKLTGLTTKALISLVVVAGIATML